MTYRGRASILGPCPPDTQASKAPKAELISQEADRPPTQIRGGRWAWYRIVHRGAGPGGTGTRASIWHKGTRPGKAVSV